MPSTTTIDLTSDVTKILQGLVSSAFATNGKNGEVISTDKGIYGFALHSIVYEPNGTVEVNYSYYENGSFKGSGINSYSSILSAFSDMCDDLYVNKDTLQLQPGTRETQGDAPEFLRDLEKAGYMEKNNCYYLDEVPPSFEKYFPLGREGNGGKGHGYMVSIDGIEQMMKECSNLLALAIPEYSETTFFDNWSVNVLNSTGCEQMLGALSSFTNTISQQASNTSDKVGMLQDQINLARSLISSFINMINQMISF
jgi:hypothetical protein